MRAEVRGRRRQALGSPPDRLGQGGGMPEPKPPGGAFARDHAYISGA
jgi:hypothetical protein